MRWLYRARQFWLALAARPDSALRTEVQAALSPALWRLFQGMQPSEQVHAWQVYRRLRSQGETDPDLLAAALLHDAGKQRCPLSVWERALIVLGGRLFPRLSQRWGEADDCSAWRRAFVTAAQHPAWGAEMAQGAGASALTVALIRRHQQALPAGSVDPEDALLCKLQRVDDKS